MCRKLQIQCNIQHIQSDLLSKCNLAVEHSASRHFPGISRQFQDPSQQFPFHLSTGLRPVFIVCFYSKLLFIVCCTAFSIHICLFTRGAILLGIESAPLSKEEEEERSRAQRYAVSCCRRSAVSVRFFGMPTHH